MKSTTQTTNDQLGYAFLLAFMAIICNLMWLLFRLFRPFSLGILPQQNFEIFAIATPPANTTPKLLYAVARLKKKTTALLTPQQQPKEEATPK